MDWQPFEEATLIPMTEQQMYDIAKAGKIPVEAVRAREADLRASSIVFKNNIYQVHVRKDIEFGIDGIEGHAVEWLHLSIKRLDREPIHDWRDLQRIKNELIGPECEALEIYPAESRLVDSANQYHLFCCTNPKYRIPFGFTERMVGDEETPTTKQRKFK